ncbi:MAG: hypothetical protein AB4368_16060 [Xenococcaceae cyanobacterium]
MKSSNNVYLAATATITPRVYPAKEAIEIFYPKEKVSKKVDKMAKLLSNNIGVQNRPMVIEPTVFPHKKLLTLEYQPKNWGITLLDKITNSINLSEIGHITVAYNVTSHQEILPNLACQIAMEANLTLDRLPTEIAYMDVQEEFLR